MSAAYVPPAAMTPGTYTVIDNSAILRAVTEMDSVGIYTLTISVSPHPVSPIHIIESKKLSGILAGIDTEKSKLMEEIKFLTEKLEESREIIAGYVETLLDYEGEINILSELLAGSTPNEIRPPW